MSKHETGNTNTETVQTVQCTVCSWIVGLLDVNIVIRRSDGRNELVRPSEL